MPITNVQKLRKSPGFLLRCGYQYSVAIVAEHLTPLNLTSVQFSTLVAVNDQPGIDATRLATLINFDRPTLTGVLDRLEAKGFIVREPDAQDRRARRLFLTPSGEKMLGDADRAAHKSRDVLLNPLPAAERKQLMLLLEKLVDLHANLHSPSAQSKDNDK